MKTYISCKSVIILYFKYEFNCIGVDDLNVLKKCVNLIIIIIIKKGGGGWNLVVMEKILFET